MPLPISAEDYQIIVSKSNKELALKKSNNIVKKYHIATGKGGQGTKRKRVSSGSAHVNCDHKCCAGVVS